MCNISIFSVDAVYGIQQSGFTQTGKGKTMIDPSLIETVVSMRKAGRTWQQIATATHRHPYTVRDIGLANGVTLCLPGRPYGGRREDWIRSAAIKASKREPFPAGHKRTWGVISAHPWPGVVL